MTPGSLKKFFVRLFAVIGLLTSIFVGLIALGIFIWVERPTPQPKAPDNMVLELDFTKPITEQTRGFSLSLQSLMHENESVRLFPLLRALEAAKTDPRVKGVIATFGVEQPSLAQAQEIRVALTRLRDTGKFAYAFGSSFGAFGLGNKTYYLASAFDELWLQPVGTVGLSGIGIEAPFGKQALATLGVHASFMQREEYKSAMESFSRDSFSAPAKANLTELIQNLADQISTGIAATRKMDPAHVRALMAQGPFTATEALKEGLVNAIGYEDSMLKKVEEKAGADYKRVDVAHYLMYRPQKPEPKATIAVLNVQGMIVDQPPRGPARLAEDEQVDTDEIVQAFDAAIKDKDVKAILMRVNSPGGSPSASESIRHALVKAKEAHKPVYISMGDVAASGGYWISMNADRIFADPGTLTGSIGVVGGKFVAGDLFKKIGITWDTVKIDGNASLWSMRTDFSPAEAARVNALMDDTYKAFQENVSAARKIPADKLASLTKGRVFTGDQAIKLGLIDEVGGMTDAITSLKKELKLAPTDLVWLRAYPTPETPTTFTFKLLKNLGLEIAGLQQTLAPFEALRQTVAPVLQLGAFASPVTATLPTTYGNLVR